MGDMGGEVNVLRTALESPSDFWQFDGSAARSLAEQFVQLRPRPQGLFVAEDRHVPTIYSALAPREFLSAPAGKCGSSPAIMSCPIWTV